MAERVCRPWTTSELADLIEPPYPDATASYKGWRVQVYDPDGELVSPSNAAADLVRAHADSKMRHSTKEEQNTWPESAEFSQLVSGQERFSEHATNADGLTVVVDHRTGVQYLVTSTGTCPLLDVDGSPLRVMEASDDGE